ncbi:EAL domain-containing protein [Neobacillus sp. SM06]|uniref:EAL domain-containing protein n=1 Tax=Neobacillus sp. SM06 TaxID=3422492 RepID=UPI003D2C2D9C
MKKLFDYLRFLHVNRERFYQEYSRERELKTLMNAKKITTFFQPILSLGHGATMGFEVLNRPDRSPHFPTTEKFYDYVGSSRAVFGIEQFLRNLSLERYSRQIETSPQFQGKLVFLNIQPQVLADPSYRSGKTLELLDRYGLSPDQIVLELTEKEAVIDYEQFEKIVGHYRRQGFRIAVDDAGTGYNSLKTLGYLKPEFIKIDKSLIRKIEEHPTQQHLVELLLEFALQSETLVIAEGIETISELRFLQNLGVQLGQGYALGHPEQELVEGKLPLSKPIIRKQLS